MAEIETDVAQNGVVAMNELKNGGCPAVIIDGCLP